MSTQRKKVLSDHKKKGKKLIPPLMSFNINTDYSYVDSGIPQIIWISVLIEKFGIIEGSLLIEELTRIIDSLEIKKEVPYYINWYRELSDSQITTITEKLKEEKLYSEIHDGLIDLLNVFPNCPLCQIFKPDKVTRENIEFIKGILFNLYDKRSKESVISLTNAVYLLGSCGKLFLVDSAKEPDINEILKYPDTEESRKVASFIRATSNVLLSERSIENDTEWKNYFWNRCLELEPCLI